MKTRRFVKYCVFLPLIALGLLALFSAIVMWLWNAILPDVTGAHALTYWQAAGILVLAKILFGGWWSGRRGGVSWRRQMIGRRLWHALTPEQREKMRAEMRERFGEWPSPECGPWTGAESPGVEKPTS